MKKNADVLKFETHRGSQVPISTQLELIERNASNKRNMIATHRDDKSVEELRISAFEGAHQAMPKYSDQYQNVKNAAEVQEIPKYI